MEIKDSIKAMTLLSKVKNQRLKKSLTKAYVSSISTSTISGSLEKNIAGAFNSLGKNKYV